MENLEQIWRTYQANKSPELKEKLIIEYSPIVKFVAGRLLVHVGQHVEYDDLVGYGVFGLIDAIDKFDLDKGVKFETYASLRIKGAIIDNIRKMDWVPRALRQKNKEFEQVNTRLEAELGREPTDEEIAAKLNTSVAEVREMMKSAAILSLVSLDDYLEQNHESAFGQRSQGDTPEEHFDKKELHKMLTETIEALTEKEKMVVTLYYFEELTLKEISGIMGVSESRISQIHSKAILRMQRKLGRFKAILFS